MTTRCLAKICVVCVAAVFAGGCGNSEDELHVEYGRQRGWRYGDSVNGTAVIGKLFAKAGHHVTVRSALSPSVEAADVIVWFPDDFDPPSAEVRRWLENWLSGGYGRTLVYVGRNFDAEPLYWRKAIPHAPQERRSEMRKRLEAAEARVEAEWKWRTSNGKVDAGWFELERSDKPRTPIELGGDWSEAVDAAKTEIELNDRMQIRGNHEPLLFAADGVVAARIVQPRFGDGVLIAVQNGSFLLNVALVNHEHRRLAAALIDAVEWQSGTECDVVFLESDGDGPAIHEQEPHAQPPTGADYPPPISDMLYHGIVLAIVVALGSWPIFGRPRRLASPPLSDFGQHVESLGDLLRRSRDERYCRERVEQWLERERK